MRANKLLALMIGVMFSGIGLAENATMSIQMALTGMDDNLGDRNIAFQIQIPSDDMELANQGWYLHLGNLLSCNTDEITAKVNRIDLTQ